MKQNLTLFLLDNVDSFSYNLVDEMRKLGYGMHIYRNTVSAQTVVEHMQRCDGPVMLILSPGPGAPSDAGCMPALLKAVQGQFPVLGICLGHQAIVEHYGGEIGRASKVLHGKSSLISHTGDGVFSSLPNPLPVARYHSLMAVKVPDCLDVCAEFEQIPMAVYHPQERMLGLQFHPESILTSQGSQLLTQSISFLTGAQ